MKNKFYLLSVSILFFAFSISIKSQSSQQVLKIDSFQSIILNGCMQKIRVQSNNPDLPILLKLHGGPGSSLILLSHLLPRLNDHYIVFDWDQRGTAFSYYEGMDSSKISVNQLLDDAVALTQYLMKTYNKKKIFLLGYSFGSFLGLELINKHPDLFYAYIGMAQAIPGKQKEGRALTYKWLRDTLNTINDTASLRMLDSDEKMYRNLVVKYNGYQLSKTPKDSLQKTSPFFFEGYKDIDRKGANFSNYHINRNSKQDARYNSPPSELQIPVYFFTASHDHACEPQLVVEYFNILKAPKKEMVWFTNSAHRMATDEPEKFQDELIRVAKENRQK